MPLPFPEVFTGHGNVAGGSAAWNLKRAICAQVTVLDWLSLGCPTCAPDDLALGISLTSRQWTAIRYMESLIVDANTPLFVDAALLGRTAGKIESMDQCLSALAKAGAILLKEEKNYYASRLSVPGNVDSGYGSQIGKAAGELKQQSSCAAKPLKAGGLIFPGPPTFDPSKYLDRGTSMLFEHPIQNGKDHLQFQGDVPRVRVFATYEDKLQLYRKLADSGRLVPVPASRRRGLHVSGLFGVDKDQQRDRLVLDGRPANLLDAEQNLWCKSMATPSVLGCIFLRNDSVLLASGEDLRDYFYQFAATEERTHRNVLSDPIPLKDAWRVFGPGFQWPEDPVEVGLSSLAMGDSLACEFAQGAHMGVLLRGGVASVSELVTLKQPLPRGLLHIGVIIDDLIALEQCLRIHVADISLNRRRTEADERMDRARTAYQTAKLETNSKKAFRNELCSQFWGIQIDGDRGLLRGNAARLWATIFISLRVASLGLCTIGLLESLAGSWISLLTVRRRMLSLMEVIFGALSWSNQKSIIRLSSELIDELNTLAILAPLAVVDLRAPAKEYMVATDASLEAMAAVNASITPCLGRELCRTALTKGRWTSLLTPAEAWNRVHDLLDDEEEIEDPYRVHPLWERCARGLQFNEQWRKLVSPGKHINVLELKAYLLEERRLSIHQKPARIVFALDSQVCLGCLVKGRSASRALNTLLKRSIAYPITCGVFSHYIYFPSRYNRADGPTRDRDPDPPDMRLPDWFFAEEEEFLRELDDWLTSIGWCEGSGLPFDALVEDKHDNQLLPSSRPSFEVLLG